VKRVKRHGVLLDNVGLRGLVSKTLAFLSKDENPVYPIQHNQKNIPNKRLSKPTWVSRLCVNNFGSQHSFA